MNSSDYTSRGIYIDPFFPNIPAPPTRLCAATTTRRTLPCMRRSKRRSASAGAGRLVCAASSAMPITAIAGTGEDLTGIDVVREGHHVGRAGDDLFRSARSFALVRHRCRVATRPAASTRRSGASASPTFLPEYLVGLDVGVKGQWLEGRLYADVTAFYMKRTDMQVADQHAARSGRSEQLSALHRQRVRRPKHGASRAACAGVRPEQIEFGGVTRARCALVTRASVPMA